jgi:hypothetical protein
VLHLLLPRPLLLILCLLDMPPLPQYTLPLPLSLCVCVIVWSETGVLESEQIPTSCNLFLYKYLVLPLPHCQIVISAQSVYVSSRLLLFRSCYPVVPVFLAWHGCPLRYNSAHISSSCYSVLDPPLHCILGFLSGPAYPVPTPPAPASALGFLQPTWASPGLHSIFPRVSINTMVTSSQSPHRSLFLGFPVPLRVTH